MPPSRLARRFEIGRRARRSDPEGEWRAGVDSTPDDEHFWTDLRESLDADGGLDWIDGPLGSHREETPVSVELSPEGRDLERFLEARLRQSNLGAAPDGDEDEAATAPAATVNGDLAEPAVSSPPVVAPPLSDFAQELVRRADPAGGSTNPPAGSRRRSPRPLPELLDAPPEAPPRPAVRFPADPR